MNELKYFKYLQDERRKRTQQCERCGCYEYDHHFNGTICESCCNELMKEEQEYEFLEFIRYERYLIDQ